MNTDLLATLDRDADAVAKVFPVGPSPASVLASFPAQEDRGWHRCVGLLTELTLG